MKIYRNYRTVKNYRSDTSQYETYYICQKADDVFLLHKYPTIEVFHDVKKPLKPENTYVLLDDEDETVKSYIAKNTYFNVTNQITEILNGNPKDYDLFLPELFSGLITTKNITEKSDIIPDGLVKRIKEKYDNNLPLVMAGIDYSNKNNIDTLNVVKPNVYYCPNCEKVFTRNKREYLKCPVCGKTDRKSDGKYLKSNIIETKEYIEYENSISSNGASKAKSISEYFLYVKTEKSGISIWRIKHEYSASNGNFIESFKVTDKIIHIPGEETKSYRIMKSSEKEIDSFDALNINSKNITKMPDIFYENADTFLEFVINNKTILERNGYIDALKYARHIYDGENFFILYLAIMNKYPILEQLLKMGHAYLWFDLYGNIMDSESKMEITRHVDRLEQLIDTTATKGKQGLRFPPYIGEYLKRKPAKIEEYYVWRDIYELTNISKEEFEKFVSSFEYAIVSPHIQMSQLANILKFGYKLPKLVRYIINESKNTDYMQPTLELLSDYLNMCDLMQIDIDLYPKNVKAAHDRIAANFKEDKGTIRQHMVISKIATQCNAFLPTESEIEDEKTGIPYALKQYAIVFPESVKDFLNEGSQQHSCVGMYPIFVTAGKSIIFFIRKKETPEKSYITAECTQRGLGQIYYENNRAVTNETERKLASWVCSKIISGCKSGSINGLWQL